MLVTARRLVRKMRGGAQAHLLEASDGHYYVVKFRNNPQHRRILVNEIIAGVFLNYLRLTTPATAVVELTEEFIGTQPDLYLQLGTRHEPVPPGWHFGSRFPGHPDQLAVYDFLPDALLGKVENRREFLGMLATDKWLGNADARQSVFFRARLRDWLGGAEQHPLRVGFVTLMMDHGFIFNGPHWQLIDAPLQGLYFRPLIYQEVRTWDDFEPWLSQLLHFPAEVCDEALRQVPLAWLEANEERDLERLCEQLLRRCRRVPDLVRDTIQARPQYFPRWRT